MDRLKPALKGQFHAALDMLKGAIEECPDALWVGGTPGRVFWDIAYHTLFYTDLYLQVREEDFAPWERHRDWEARERPGAVPYSKTEMLTYWDRVDARVDLQVDKIDLASPESGFDWYHMPKLDHLLLNLRHIQEHAGQLRDRLLEADVDQEWVSVR